MSHTPELYEAMDRLMENRPELRGKSTPNVNELLYFLLFQGYIDIDSDPSNDEIRVAHFLSNLDAFLPSHNEA